MKLSVNEYYGMNSESYHYYEKIIVVIAEYLKISIYELKILGIINEIIEDLNDYGG